MKNSDCPSLRLLELLVKDATRRRDKSTSKDHSQAWSTTDRVQLMQALINQHLERCPVCQQKSADTVGMLTKAV